MEFLRYNGWQAFRRTSEDVISLSPARRLLATLDRDPDALQKGDALPVLWHWLYFLPAVRISRLGHDGHAIRGGFMPPVSLPVRMFAGFELDVRRPLVLGQQAWRSEEVTKIEEKQGDSGTLVFVTVEFRIEDQKGLVLVETQTYVYRNAGPLKKPEASGGSREGVSHVRVMDVPITPALLFRFSALTFNSHRIHYDRAYAEEEGYPGLVAHGPLVALLMTELIPDEWKDRPMRLVFRQRAPLFEGDTLSVKAVKRDEGILRTEAFRKDGLLCAKGECALDGAS